MKHILFIISYVSRFPGTIYPFQIVQDCVIQYICTQFSECPTSTINSQFLALTTNATVAVTAPATPIVVSLKTVTVFVVIMVAAVVLVMVVGEIGLIALSTATQQPILIFAYLQRSKQQQQQRQGKHIFGNNNLILIPDLGRISKFDFLGDKKNRFALVLLNPLRTTLSFL